MSVTENGKEGKSKVIASCGFLEDELRQFSREEGVTLADSVGTLGVDLRTRVQRLGAKEKARRKKCNVRFSVIKKSKAFRKNYMKVGVKKLSRAGVMPARTWGAHAVEMFQTERLKLRGQMAAAPGKKEYDFIVLVHGDIRPRGGRRAAHYGYSVLGGRSMDKKMESRAKRSLDEADSGGSNVETGERACRSSDV